MDTKDHLVHCVKPGRVAVDAAEPIPAATDKLIAGNDDYDVSNLMKTWTTMKL